MKKFFILSMVLIGTLASCTSASSAEETTTQDSTTVQPTAVDTLSTEVQTETVTH